MTIHQGMGAQEAVRKAWWMVGTTILATTARADAALAATSKEQGGVERGFRFLKDPLLLASSVCVKQPERILALRVILVLCILVSRLAECRLRARVAQTQHTIPDQRLQTDDPPDHALGVAVR